MKQNAFFAGIIGMISAVLMLGIRISSENNKDAVADYMISIICFFAITLISYVIISKTGIGEFLSGRLINVRLLMGIMVVLSIILVRGMIRCDDGFLGANVDGFFWHMLPLGIVTLIYGVVGVISFCAYLKVYHYSGKGIGLIVYYCSLAALYACTVVYFNPFAADIYHIDAYLHPIYSVFFNAPYSEVSYGIYGHYELFYKPIMMLFGTSPVVICFTLWILALICALIVFYIIHWLVEPNYIRILCSIAMLVPTGVMFKSSSYQTTPHRVFFPLIILFYACYISKKQDKPRKLSAREFVIGNIICILSILWSTEISFVVIAGWYFYLYVLLLQVTTNAFADTVRFILKSAIYVIVDFILALIILNTYNIIVGGKLYIAEFFSTLTNKSFMEHYIVSIQFKNLPYIYIMIAGAAAVIFAIRETRLFGNYKYNTKAALAGTIGTVTLGIMVYYVTRAAYYGLIIVVPFTIILLGFFAYSLSGQRIVSLTENKHSKCELYQGIKVGISYFCITVLSMMTLMSGTLLIDIAGLYRGGRYTFMQLRNEASVFEQEINKDTYALGWGVDEIYGFLGWDAGYHLFGTTDVLMDPEANATVYAELKKELEEQQEILINDDNFKQRNIIPIDFILEKEILFQGRGYGLFVKHDHVPCIKTDISAFSLSDRVIETDASKSYISDLRDIFVVGFGSSTEDLSPYTVIGLKAKDDDTLFLLDTSQVEYVSNKDEKSKRLFARFYSDEVDLTKQYEVMFIDNAGNMVLTNYSMGAMR